MDTLQTQSANSASDPSTATCAADMEKAQKSINLWLSQGAEAETMGDTFWAELSAEKVTKYQSILASLQKTA
ncbi:hypothetical protein [Pseudomonas sp. W2Jun17]|uniref:hypothetical protein n=1 Tax=Pseudomonas sp. W2Jun17 TaxID=1553460 RepID=UPI002003FDC1|nr:hypothetical protein [Pseudomonas sp. W2Jun17]MCK3850863.1 hypothetical protein [Pseudomonas sp. W2Jun17]